MRLRAEPGAGEPSANDWGGSYREGGREGGCIYCCFLHGDGRGAQTAVVQSGSPRGSLRPPSAGAAPPDALLRFLRGEKGIGRGGGRRGGSAAASFKRRLKGSPGASAPPIRSCEPPRPHRCSPASPFSPADPSGTALPPPGAEGRSAGLRG